MGYRSDVAYRVEMTDLKYTREVFTAIESFLEVNGKSILKDAYRRNIDVDNGLVTIAFYDIKWYQCYDDVARFNELVDKMADIVNHQENAAEDNPFRNLVGKVSGQHFIRIGEELTDIEDIVDGDMYATMSIDCHICFD